MIMNITLGLQRVSTWGFIYNTALKASNPELDDGGVTRTTTNIGRSFSQPKILCAVNEINSTITVILRDVYVLAVRAHGDVRPCSPQED